MRIERIGVALLTAATCIPSYATECWISVPVPGTATPCACSDSYSDPCPGTAFERYQYNTCVPAGPGQPGTTGRYFIPEGANGSIVGYVMQCDEQANWWSLLACLGVATGCSFACGTLSPACLLCLAGVGGVCLPCVVMRCEPPATPFATITSAVVCVQTGSPCFGSVGGGSGGHGSAGGGGSGTLPPAPPAPGSGDHTETPPHED